MTQAEAPPALARVMTLTYNGPVPYPGKEVTLPTPDEQFEKHQKQQEALDASREAALKEEQAKAKTGGFMGKFGAIAKNVAHSATKAANQLHGTVESKVRSELKDKEKAKWQKDFPDQAAAHYVCSYTCFVMHGGQLVEGTLSLSSTHVNFRNLHVSESIPLDTVLCLQRSVVLPTHAGGPPYILPCPAEHVIPQCVQIFTKNRQLFQFLNFANTATSTSAHFTTSIQGNAFERCYNFLDHAWRAATQVPQPGTDYLPPPQ
eukprot:TRINITY_DN14884_c1_g1_i1.p1 TRINITY_DN14884_c1_g1~~TRINITY_DN14884_c1_g1_i1.p1  ORF type:complete len:261 (+),score=106.40 TRINITY_DN14884_c1_g1_i1:137-919(+)